MTEQADDLEVLSKAIDWLNAGKRVALAMVVRTWGSSPRPAGSLLAMNNGGQFLGSVSDGCVEESLVARYRDGEIAGPAPTMLDYSGPVRSHGVPPTESSPASPWAGGSAAAADCWASWPPKTSSEKIRRRRIQ